MSMAVDLSTPLTEDERAYLNERGRTEDIARVDALHGVTDAPALPNGDGSGPVVSPRGTAEQAAGGKERLMAELQAMGVNVQEVPAEEAEADDDEVPPYEAWKSADLNAEIDRRNQTLPDGEKISKSGTVQERADRLYKDDEKNA